MITQKDKKYLSPEDPLLKELLLRYFPNANTYLDLGCGSGANMAMVHKLGLLCSGITLSEEELELAKKFGECFIFNLENGLPQQVKKQTFDLVVAAHLLEHVFYPDQLLADIRCVADQGAIIVIPNILYWKNRVKLFIGIWQYQELGIMDYTHSRWYSYKTIQELMEKNGFHVIRKTATGGLFSGNSAVAKHINRKLLKMFPGLFGFQFYLVVKVRI